MLGKLARVDGQVSPEEIRSVENFMQNDLRLDAQSRRVAMEIFHAAGILPVRLRGIGTDNLAIGDAYFGPYICSFPKCILQLAGEGRFDFLDGTVITPGCDSMRRLDECWRKAGDDHPGIVPGFFYYFDVPHKTEPHGTAWFEEEIRNLICAVETRFNVCITPEKLQASIVLFNKGRDLLARMEALRSARPGAISGADAFAVAVAGTVMPREDYTRQLADYLAAVSDRGKSNAPKGQKRLMVLGSIYAGVASFIEKTAYALAGIVIGGFLSAILVREFDLRFRLPLRQYAMVLTGGLIVGLGARIMT